MPRRRAVATAVVRRAEMRAALQHLAGNFGGGLAGVVTALFAAAARILGDAAGCWRLALVLRRVPVAGPLPDIADHVADAVAVRRKGGHRRRALVTILTVIMARKLALP